MLLTKISILADLLYKHNAYIGEHGPTIDGPFKWHWQDILHIWQQASLSWQQPKGGNHLPDRFHLPISTCAVLSHPELVFGYTSHNY